MPDRQLPLRFAGVCRLCAQPLPVGTLARWYPDTKQVACLHCLGTAPPVQPARPAASHRPRPPAS